MKSTKNWIYRVTAVALALFVAIAMTVGLQLRPVNAAAAFVIVSPSNLNGWVQAHSTCGAPGTGSQEFVEGPATPPLNEGSLRFLIGSNGDSFETIRTPDFNGTRIDDLTLLQYSTYVTNFVDEQAPYLLLSVDEDGDNMSNALWFFEPVYQDATFFPSNPQANVVEGMWQTWDALNGGWYSTSGLAGSGPGTNVKSIAQLLAAAPNARLAPTGVGSLRIATGCGGAAWADFDGNVDALMVGTASDSEMLPDNLITYDFEPNPSVDGPCVTPPAGMVSWWPGDGTAEDIQDGNDGTLQNGATATAPGFVDQAFSFDGIDDFVNVPNNANLEPATITVDFWFNSGAPGANAYLLAKGAQTNQFASYSFNTSGTGGGLAFDVLVNNTFVRSPFSSPLVFDGQWHHATGTFDGTTVRLYIDGVEVGTGTPAVGSLTYGLTPNNDLTLGRFNGTIVLSYAGLLDEVEIFDHALTPTEIASIHGAGSAGKCKECVTPPTEMVSWWPGDGTAEDIQDGNDGVNSGTYAPGMVDQAFNFTAQGQFVTVPDAANLDFPPTGPITVDMWVFKTAANPIVHYLGKRVGCGSINYQLAEDPMRGLHFSGEPGTGVQTGTSVPVNEWVHIAATYDGTTWRIYVNGNEEGSTTTGGTLGPVNTAPLEIGASGTCGNTFPGLIDEVEIFNRALSAEEIASIFQAGSLGKCKGCEATDTTPPVIDCPDNVVASTQPKCQPATAGTVNFAAPTATDDCTAEPTVVCVPPSGSMFNTGTTTVTCTATDEAGNTAMCSFTVTLFNVCLQDDTKPGTVLLFNATTGEYIFCCNGMTFTGTGTITKRGCVITLTHNAPDRRVTGRVDLTAFAGSGSLQAPPGQTKCTITDRDVRNNTCACSVPPTNGSLR